MKNKSVRMFISCFIVITIAYSSTMFVCAGTNVNVSSTPTQTELKIQKLLDQRAELLIQSDVNVSSVNNIDIQLHKLGVSFLDTDQVNAQFPVSKNYRNGKISETIIPNKTHGAEIYSITPPSSTKNSWMTYPISNYYFNGKYYNIQKLIAQPIDSSSALCNIGSRIVTFDYNWSTGVQNLINSVGTSLAGTIPGSTFVLSFYDAIRSFFSGISKTTEVDVPNIAYSWSNVTTVMFTYVRLESQTDDSQWLSQISSKTQTAVGYNIPKFSYKNSSGSWVLTPQIVQDNKTISLTPTDYDNNYTALASYNSGTPGPYTAEVGSIVISSPESKSVQTIYPCCPNFPLGCEY